MTKRTKKGNAKPRVLPMEQRVDQAVKEFMQTVPPWWSARDRVVAQQVAYELIPFTELFLEGSRIGWRATSALLDAIKEMVDMPAKSRAQQHLMAAAAHGADFKKAREVRASMTEKQLRDYAKTPTRRLPGHVKKGR